MNNEEEMNGEITRLKREIERLRMENTGINQGMIKKKAEVAGNMTDIGIFEEEIKKMGFSGGFDREEVKVTNYFSVKGHGLEKGKVCRCSFCSLILTEGEKIEINNKIFCEKCYRTEEHDLDKNDYKILICILSGFTSTSPLMEYIGFAVTVQKITGIIKSEIDKKIEKLLEQGYLFLHGFIFKSIRISSKGEEALAAYNQIYQDEDCNRVKNKILLMGV